MDKLTVVVGAGASIKGGSPSVSALTSAIRNLQTPQILGDFRDFMQMTPHGLQRNTPLIRPSEPAILQIDRALRSIREDYNFETLLHAVETLEPFVAARTLHHDLLKVRPVLSAFADPTPRYEGLMSWNLLWNLRWEIIRLIRDNVANGAARVKRSYTDASNRLLEALRSRFIVQVFNLNYDALLESGIDWADGFAKAVPWTRFDSKAYTAAFDGNEHLMTHLHGSVYYGYMTLDPKAVAPYVQRQVVKYADLDEATASLKAPPPPTYTDDVIDDAAPIISGANKALKLTTVPYAYYFSALQQAAQRNSKFLFLGYGFADPHINNWIIESVRHHGEDRVRACIVDFYAPDSGEYRLEENATFIELRSRLGGPQNLTDTTTREFAESSRMAVSVDGYPMRDDISEKIVSFLERA